MSEGISTLLYAARPAVLGKYLGQLCVVLALLTTAPLGAALFFQDYASSSRYAAIILLLLLLYWPSRRLAVPAQLQQNEALVIVALTFLLSPLLMSYPMMAAGLSWSDALFEAISAVTTTGLSTLPGVEGLAPGFLFARAWGQWYGGLGIVVLSIALLHGHHIASRRLAEPPSGEGLVTTTRTYARRILKVYLLLTVLAIVVLLLLGLDPAAAVNHALSAVSTGGFSSYDDSLAHFGSAPALAVILLGLCGALPLHLYYQVRQRGLRETLQDVELRTLLLLCLLGSGLLSLFLHRHGMAWSEALFHGTIQGLSAQSTSGFSSLEVATLDNASKLSLIFSMLLGGGVGSTAGGIKLLRLLILLRLMQLLLRRSAMPEHAVAPSRLAGRPLEADDIQTALQLILLFLLVIALSWLAFVIYGYPPLDALFEVVSASGTVGLSTGITRAELEPLLQAVLAADMLLGRLEIVALLVVLYPPTWFAKRTES
jgi:trk system potassium uptake protein TrkH